MRPEEAGRVLGVEPPSLQGVRSLEEARSRVQTWKDTTVKQAHRREARKWHPDKAGADVAECTARMKRVNEARDVLNQVEVVAPRPRPVYTRIVFHGGGFSSATTSGTSSTVTGSWFF